MIGMEQHFHFQDKLERSTEILGNLLWKISIPYDSSWNYQNFQSDTCVVHFSEIQRYLVFLETLPANFLNICPRFRIVRTFG